MIFTIKCKTGKISLKAELKQELKIIWMIMNVEVSKMDFADVGGMFTWYVNLLILPFYEIWQWFALLLQDPDPVQFSTIYSSSPNAEVLFISR